MITLNNVNTTKLHAELLNANVNVINVETDGVNTFIKLDASADMQLVQQVIDAHDPTPIPLQPNDHDELLNYVLDLDMRMIMIEMGLILN